MNREERRRQEKLLAKRAGTVPAVQVSAFLHEAQRHHQAGRLDEAERGYRLILERESAQSEALHGLGLLAYRRGNLQGALEWLARACSTEPRNPVYWFNHGVVLQRAGLVTEAVEAYRRAIALKPTHAEAQNNLGLVLLEQGRTDEAIRCFERALQILPGYGTALYNLGIAWIWQGDPARALRRFAETAALKHDHGRSVTEQTVFRSRLKHDAEQMQYLFAAGLAGDEWRPYYEALNRLRVKVEPAQGDSASSNRLALPPADLQPVAASFNRLIYVAPCETIAGGALNPDLDVAAIEARYHATQPEVISIDGLLTEEALKRLRHFCWTSTIWKKDYENGYIGAFLGDGFASPLLLQIAEELRRRLPRIFGAHRLTQAWAFKHDSARRGLNIHADAAAVNVNFWITADEANLNRDSGGLVVWDKEAPREWDFKTYNSDRNRGRIYEWLREQRAQEIKIPYRANRAVVFNSDLFHETDDISFKEGFTNRRINVTLLYGHRHRP